MADEKDTGFTWPDEAVAQLRAMVEDGKLSAAEMAARFSEAFGVSVSRNSVLGKMHRMKLSSGFKGVTGRPRLSETAKTVMTSSAPAINLAAKTAPRRFVPPQQAFSKQPKSPPARSLAETTASSTAEGSAPLPPRPAQQGEAGDRSASPDILPPASLPVVFRPPVGILNVTGCRATVGADAEVIGRWLFCDQALVEGSSYCHHHHPLLSAPRVRPPGIPTDNQVRRNEREPSERVKALDEMIVGR